MTSLGACIIYFIKNIDVNIKKLSLGFASGIMMSSSIFSMIIPAIDYSIYITCIGFLFGASFIILLDKLMPLINISTNKKTDKMFLAILLHNLPEGLAVGASFGLALLDKSLMIEALIFSIGIGIQNFPEGMSVSLIMNENKNIKESIFYGIFSGAVEPIMAFIGLTLITKIDFMMPWLLSFSAGSMIFVIVEELVPEFNEEGHSNYGTITFMISFALMMFLDCIF